MSDRSGNLKLKTEIELEWNWVRLIENSLSNRCALCQLVRVAKYRFSVVSLTKIWRRTTSGENLTGHEFNGTLA